MKRLIMKNYFSRVLMVVTLFLTSIVSAQKRTEDFTISLPTKKVDKSYYKTIKLIDRRTDTTSLGIVQQGLLNAKARVVSASSLSSQFQNVLNGINGENTEDGTLVLYLKQLYFAELTAKLSEHGYCYFQAFLFSKNDDGTYSLIDQSDKVIDHRATDVTKETLQKGSEMLIDFISTNAAKKPETTHHYTYEQVKNFDDTAKESIPFYSSSPLKDGVYKDYNSLKNQQPDQEISNVKFYGNAPKIVRIYETADGKEKEIKKDDIYAVVYKGEPYLYLSIENLFTRAEKRDNDYYFIGKIRSDPNRGSMMVTGAAFFGAIGVLIMTNPAYPFEMKINYFNGGFIPVKEIQNKRY
ncbi:hypothetical protein [Chryseobacterium rhizosphaerae]|uniref:Uncharacterized protein n=1 Tax=Chryseobacterium rhizosphaerae TaxID=395937 RepID=A0ABX9IR45_9FLAO|nr:hypothetical protein [Chryseobacterium rhizosphaerae]REC78760.1 hypothetical protein DRF57_00320 [Chryseobacterium rhizosphaerae]